MLSELGIIFISIALLISLILVYFSLIEVKNSNNIIPKKIYKFSLLQLIFSAMSFIVLLVGYVFLNTH